METKTRGMILFAIVLVYYMILSMFSGQVSATVQIILHTIWVIFFWTFVFWIFRNVVFFKKLIPKFTEFSLFKYGGYLLFVILSINACLAFLRYDGTKALIMFWVYLFFGLVFIPVFYGLGWLFSKLEKNEWFSKRAIEIQAGLFIVIILSAIYLVVGSFVLLFGTANLQGFIPALIALSIFGFVLGVIIGFICRIYYKVFTRTSKLFEK